MATCRHGFTLLELICALGVLSVLFAISLPRVSALVPALLVDRAAWQLVSELQLARLKAVNRNTRVRTIVELGAARYRIESESEGRFEPEGAERPLPAGVTFDASTSTRVSGGTISITYAARGQTSDNATIALSGASGASRRIVVSGAGRVRVQ
jgi:type IV fimbrial biogenesis protein FimT